MQQMNYWWAKWQAQFFFNTHQFSIVFSLFSFPLNKQGSNARHQTSQNSATLYCFSLFSFQQTNKGIHLPHTPLDRAPPTHKHTSLGLKSFIYLLVWVSNDVGIEELGCPYKLLLPSFRAWPWDRPEKKEKKTPTSPTSHIWEKKVGICGWEEGNPYIGGPT